MESLGSFLLLFVLSSITGALSSFVGIHLLFRFVRDIERWRGQRVAVFCTALLCGIPAFMLVVFPLIAIRMIRGTVLGLGTAFIEGIFVGLIGALVGGVFASGAIKRGWIKIMVVGGMLGFLVGSSANFFIGLFILRPIAGAENYLLVVPFFIFVVIGGLTGLLGGGVYGFRKSREKIPN